MKEIEEGRSEVQVSCNQFKISLCYIRLSQEKSIKVTLQIWGRSRIGYMCYTVQPWWSFQSLCSVKGWETHFNLTKFWIFRQRLDWKLETGGVGESSTDGILLQGAIPGRLPALELTPGSSCSVMVRLCLLLQFPTVRGAEETAPSPQGRGLQQRTPWGPSLELPWESLQYRASGQTGLQWLCLLSQCVKRVRWTMKTFHLLNRGIWCYQKR